MLFQKLEYAVRVFQGRILSGDALFVELVGPGLPVVFRVLFVVAGEDAVQVARHFEIRMDEERCVRVLDHVVLEKEVIFQDVVDHPPEEGDVGSGTDGRVEIRYRRRLRESRIHADELPAPLLRLHDPLHRNGVIRCGVATHDEDDVGILQVAPVIRHRAAAERLSQSRYGGGVSEPGLVFDMHQPPRAHQLLHEIALFIVEGRASHVRDAFGPVHDELLLHIGERLAVQARFFG